MYVGIFHLRQRDGRRERENEISAHKNWFSIYMATYHTLAHNLTHKHTVNTIIAIILMLSLNSQVAERRGQEGGGRREGGVGERKM